jgi:hypothetical protein
MLRKEERRVKRRIRDIDAMVELIKKEVIDKGEMREGVTSCNLDQVHANYRQNTRIVGSLGGLFLQLVVVVQAFFEAFALPTESEDEKKQREKLRAFLTLEGVTNFLYNYLKDAKFEQITL